MGAALMWGANADPILDEPVKTRPQHFTPADYQAFDRNFSYGGATCEVGLKRKEICFGASPFEPVLASGVSIPENSPNMPAEFPVILNTELKAEGLDTWRFGRTLVLVRSGTRDIVDVMDLAAPYQDGDDTLLASR